jgi:hypothetical protein
MSTGMRKLGEIGKRTDMKMPQKITGLQIYIFEMFRNLNTQEEIFK